MRTTILSMLILFLSCSDNPVSGNLSTLGIYASPETVIAELKGKQDGYEERFLLGLAYKKQKKQKEAIFHFANSCFKSHRDASLRLFPQPVYYFVKGFHFKSPYYDDAVYEIAQLFYQFKEHSYVVKFTDLVSKDEKVLYRDAMLLKGRSLAALERYGDAMATLKNIIDRYDDPDSRSIAYLRAGSIQEKKSDYPSALNYYLKIFAIDLKGWQSSIAARRARGIMEQNPQKLNFEKKLLYAKSLYYAKEYREAAAALTSLKSGDADRPELNLFLVKALARNNETGKAETLAARYSGSSQYLDLLKGYADELWDMNRKQNALPAYQRVLKTGQEPYAHDSLQRVAQFVEERKQAGYDKYLSDYYKKYSDNESSHFLWLMGRNLIRAKNMEAARQLLEESVSKYPRGSYSDESRFWLYKIYEEKKRDVDALKTAVALIVLNPDSPYAWLLIKKLSGRIPLPDMENKFRAALEKGDRDLAQFYHSLLFAKEKSVRKRNHRIDRLKSAEIEPFRDLERAVEKLAVSSKCGAFANSIEKYFRIGHIEGIKRELKIVPKSKECARDKYILMAHFARKYGYAYWSVYSYLELLKIWNLKENIALMPEESLRGLFPTPFGACVAEYCRQYGIEKNILYSIMKAESLFKHNAVSSAGAVGLMQLMPATAKGIARSLRIGSFDPNDPCTSIKIGAKFIAGLSRDFKGNFQYLVAAYNAGPGNVGKWKDRLNSGDMDYFTEFTPFIETRYYILRTDKFLTQYSLIYDERR
jgi:soluble lytic murein transglycosylase